MDHLYGREKYILKLADLQTSSEVLRECWKQFIKQCCKVVKGRQVFINFWYHV